MFHESQEIRKAGAQGKQTVNFTTSVGAIGFGGIG